MIVGENYLLIKKKLKTPTEHSLDCSPPFWYGGGGGGGGGGSGGEPRQGHCGEGRE